MNTDLIFRFLKGIAANNNREWFAEHKAEFLEARKDFEDEIRRAIVRIAQFDASVANVDVKESMYRFNRDTRFSPDKAPYKRHFGAFINAHGKKSLRGGYYIHVEPGNCLLAVGSYWLPTNILTACRNEIMGNIDDWRKLVEKKSFVALFGKPGEARWGDEKGFGLDHLKTCPSGFPRDYEFVQYLRMKDYCCWRGVPDDFFARDGWLDEMAKVMKEGKPMMDFMNGVIDDYE
jgi:uncharacterized protein (TIGR02453 family)